MFAIVYITHETEEHAQSLSNKIVGERLAACANIFPISSCYWWHGEVQNENEWVSILKTTVDKWPTLKERVTKLHRYDVPCIMKIEVEANEAYEKWIVESTR